MMMPDFLKHKNILIGLVILALAFFAYRFFFVKEEDIGPSVLVADKASISEEERSILELLSDMQSISLDTSILKNKNFLNLQDFSVSITPEPQGRDNPFSPVGTNSTVTPVPNGKINTTGVSTP